MRKKGCEGEDNPPKIFDIIKSYIELKVEYYKLSLVEKASLLVGWIILMFFLGIFGLALLLLLMLLIYNLLIEWIGIPWVVTVIEIGLLGILTCILWYGKKAIIIRPVASMMLRVLLDSDSKDDEEDDDE